MNEILEGYSAAATPEFIAAYDQLRPKRIYEHVIDLFPEQPAKIADIGAGTGRDSAWFAGRGHDVLAVEPVRELREAGQKLHRSGKITWVDDRLPHLAKVQFSGGFDLVTLCAVWQHLPDPDRRSAMAQLARLTAPRGRLVMSLRHGPGGLGRPVFPVSPEVTIAAAQAENLSLVRRREGESVQPKNRALGVSWTWLAFEKVS